MNNATGLAGGIGLTICLISAPTHAQSVQRYDIAAMDLAAALRMFAATSGREVVAASEIVAGKRSARVTGNLSPEQALAQMLAPSGLRAELVDGAFVLRPLEVAASAPPALDEGEVVVTGTRIRGAPVASPVISLRREALQQAGQATIADALRTIPQNFGGGQNPGIGFNVPEANGADVGGGASVNLRGLGSDATLTLLDGRRLSYSGPSQSVDVSAIPFGAIARVEIVPDGASALFGSDAVAGVVNIILRRDLDGLEVGGRLGASTDGGNFQQQYAATGGKTWRSGSALLAYEFGRTTPIQAHQRSYSEQRTPGLTLYPYLRRHSAMLVASQQLSERLSLDLDGGYNKRWSDTTYPLNFAGDLAISRATTFTVAESLVVAPVLKWQAPGGWQVALAGSYGSDRVAYGGDFFFGTTRVDPGSGRYLDSDQQLAAGQAVTPLSGQLFNPPHWRARGELAATRGPISATGAVSYIGPVRDGRDGADERIAGMTPIDLTLRYTAERGGALADGLDITLSVQNLLNDKPSTIVTSLFYDTLADVLQFDLPAPPPVPPPCPSEAWQAAKPEPPRTTVPTSPPRTQLSPQLLEARELGEGGPKHRYLQNLIKELAAQQGFRAIIEAPIECGKGQVDLLLSREGMQVAFEVSVRRRWSRSVQILLGACLPTLTA